MKGRTILYVTFWRLTARQGGALEPRMWTALMLSFKLFSFDMVVILRAFTGIRRKEKKQLLIFKLNICLRVPH